MNNRVPCALFVAIFLTSSLALAQTNKKAVQVAPPQAAPAKAGVKDKAPLNSGAIADSASKALNQIASPGADYIPCRFTYGELRSLNAPEQVLTLSPADAESLVEKVTSTIQQQQVAGLISSELERELLIAITENTFVGLTPSQALQKIIEASVTAKSYAVKVTKDEQTSSQNMAPIFNSARDTIERLSRPLDVGCAMSVLSYNETSKAYGYIIANNYIAVQVVVRNLNRDQQFVLHDVEYSVNTDPAGTSGRFSSGRDKIIVRALASAEGSFDPRNMVVHGAQSAGALLTTLVPIFGGAIGAASAVYNGGFFPGLDKVWKDMSTDQLNLLNDSGFSSSSSSQTVVPKAGTSMFVTFIPSKQFENGWWTQSCVTSTPLGTISNNQIRALVPLTVGSKAETSSSSVPIEEALQACAFQAFKKYVAQRKAGDKAVKRSHDSGVTVVPGTLSAVDLALALPNDAEASEECKQVVLKNENNLTDMSSQDKANLAECAKPATLYASVPKRLFRHWNGNSVALFQELSTVVVAGMHIVDESALQPSLTSIDCTKDPVGTIVFPTPDAGSIACPVKGQNLAKVKSLRLRNADESGYTDGSVVPASGDDTTGTVTFNSSALHALDKTDYEVSAISTTGVETATTQVLHFDLLPYVAKTTPAALDANTPLLTIDGYHLDKVAEVHFYMTDPKSAAIFKVTLDTLPTDREVKITLNATELAKIGKTAADVKWSFILADTGKEVVAPTALKYTPASAPTPVAAAPVKPAKKKTGAAPHK
jgi:hypothetical protein